jgi:hypothetical protein
VAELPFWTRVEIRRAEGKVKKSFSIIGIALFLIYDPQPALAVTIGVDCRGTYLRVNTHPSGGQKPDVASKPTTISLSGLGIERLPAKNRFLALQFQGQFFDFLPIMTVRMAINTPRREG